MGYTGRGIGRNRKSKKPKRGKRMEKYTDLEQALKTLQETKIPDKGRWCLSLIVREENGVWLGAGRREDGREVRVRYSGQFGLEIV